MHSKSRTKQKKQTKSKQNKSINSNISKHNPFHQSEKIQTFAKANISVNQLNQQSIDGQFRKSLVQKKRKQFKHNNSKSVFIENQMLSQNCTNNASDVPAKIRKTKKHTSQISCQSILQLNNKRQSNLNIIPQQKKINIAVNKTTKIKDFTTTVRKQESFVNKKNKTKKVGNSKNTSIYSSIADMRLPLSHSNSYIDFSDKGQSTLGHTLLEKNNFFKKKNGIYINSEEDAAIKQNYKNIENRAAILIQKTWRGHQTRKLLERYIQSFEQIYEKKLNSIIISKSQLNSGRSIKNLQSSNQKSLKSHDYSDKNDEYLSQVNYIEKNYRSISKECSFLQQVNSQQRQKQKQNYYSEFPCQIKEVNQIKDCQFKYDMKQYSQTQTEIDKQKEEMDTVGESRSTQFTAEIYSRVRVQPNNVNNSSKQQKLIKSKQKNQKLSIQSVFNYQQMPIVQFKQDQQNHQHNNKDSYLQKVSTLKSQFNTLFSNFNLECLRIMKNSLKTDQLNLKQFLDRKKSLQNIKENGFDFIQSVQNQVTNALKQMKKIALFGQQTLTQQKMECEESQLEAGQSQYHQSQTSTPDKQMVQRKKRKVYNLKTSEYREQNNQFQENDTDQCQGQSQSQGSQNFKSGSKLPSSQFYTIQLPTQEYSAKAVRSPIQQDDQNSDAQLNNQSDSNEQYSQEQADCIEHPSNNQYYSSKLSSQQFQQSRQSIEVLNQFLSNLVEQCIEYQQNTGKSELQYLCQALSDISSNKDEKTVIDRCLIEFTVEIITEQYSLTQIYEQFKMLVQRQTDSNCNEETNNEVKCMIVKWIGELHKWEMNIIQQVASGMESSSFINTENISFQSYKQHQSLHDSINANQ